MHNLLTDPRAFKRKIGPQAWPGLLAGAVIALPIISIVDSFQSGFQLIPSLYNLGLPDNEKMTCLDEIQKDSRRHWMKKYGLLAWPGLAVGAIFGFTCGMIADSIKSGSGVFNTIYNVGIDNDHKIHGNEIQHDTRGWYRIGGPQAWPGLFAGATLGVVSAILVDSIRSGAGLFTSIYNAGLPAAQKLSLTEIQNDTRKWYRIGGIQAWPGLITGSIAGLVGSYLVDNIKSGLSTYATIVNKMLADDKITSIPELANDQRYWVKKYGAVFGLAVGGILGCLSVCAIKTGHFCVDVFDSWKNLSGSILNVAIERPYFAGLSQARTSTEDTLSQSLAKAVGYGIAVPSTGIVGCAIYLARKAPDAFLLTSAVICSPITTLIKGIAYLVGSQPRFPANLDTDQIIEQAFKDIFSSLDGLGRLPVGKKITTGNGSENGWSVFRKCMTFNSKTPTEVTLNALLDAFRNYKGESFFTDRIYNVTINNVKDEYRKDWFLSQQQIDLTCQEVQDVSDFVLNYIGEAKVVSVEKNFYTKKETSWNTLFFRTKPALGHQSQEQVQDRMDLNPIYARPTT